MRRAGSSFSDTYKFPETSFPGGLELIEEFMDQDFDVENFLKAYNMEEGSPEKEKNSLLRNLFPTGTGLEKKSKQNRTHSQDFERRSSSLTTLSTVAQMESSGDPLLATEISPSKALLKPGFYSQLFDKL